MKQTFKYDVAISAAEFDALAAAELQRRLEQRLRHGVYVNLGAAASPRTPASAATARRAFEKDARVVVVLFQRLWSAGVASEADAAAIRARITKSGRRGVIVVALDHSPLPSWLRGGTKSKGTAPDSDAVIDQIVAAVVAAGGTPFPETDERIAARNATEEGRAKARTTFLASQRAITLVTRELDALAAAVTRCCGETGVLPDGLVPAVRRTPDRYTVQIGPVGLSFSWIRGRSNTIADGQLLVIEWAGQLGEKQAESDSHAAMPTFEHVLQPHATCPEDWQWRRSDLDVCSYTTRDLAAQCVTSVLRRLPPPVRDTVPRDVARPVVRETAKEGRTA